MKIKQMPENLTRFSPWTFKRGECQVATEKSWGELRKLNEAADREGAAKVVFVDQDFFGEWDGILEYGNTRKPLILEDDNGPIGATVGNLFIPIYAGLNHIRARLVREAAATPMLDWIVWSRFLDFNEQMLPDRIRAGEAWPKNLFVGLAVRGQGRYHEALRNMAEVPAPVRFLDIDPVPERFDPDTMMDGHRREPDGTIRRGLFDWVVVGNIATDASLEPQPAEAIARIRDYAQFNEIPFRFTGWGKYVGWDGLQSPGPAMRDPKGRPYCLAGENALKLNGREFSEMPDIRS